MEPQCDPQALVKAAFQEARFLDDPSVEVRDRRLDFIGKHNGKRFFGQVRTVREGRGDRLIPLIAQTVLEVQAHGKHQQLDDLVAIVAAPHITASAARKAIKFAQEYAPGIAIGVFDFDGRRLFSRQDLEDLNAAPRGASRGPTTNANLFSDLNQWMLKVLLAERLKQQEVLLRSPEGRYRNATELSDAAKVTVMSAFRLISALKENGFLDETNSTLRLVRTQELLLQWQTTYQQPVRELPVRWLIPAASGAKLSAAVKAYGSRACLGLFAAARALGYGHVSNVPVHVYVDSFDASGLDRMGVVVARPDESPDLVLRIPKAKESVFRGQVNVVPGGRSCDIIQVWLDVAWHPSRGREQADLIYRKVIEPMLVGI